jgi:signal transduction histidine kinase
MKVRTRSRLAWGIAVVSVVVVSAYVALGFALGYSDDLFLNTLLLGTVIAFAPVGALIAGRTGNAVGWALLAVIASAAVFAAADVYATYAFATAETRLPFGGFAALLETLAFFLALLLLVAIPLLYPTGRPRWRWVWRAYVVATSTIILGFAILPGDLSLANGGEVPNPFAIASLEGIVGVILAAAGLTIFSCVVLSIVALILRYREARGDERQQIRWLAYLGVATVVLFGTMIAVSAAAGENSGIAQIASDLFFGTVLLGIPAACAVAILKYHLYDLDVVVKKAVVFGLLAAFVTAVYAIVVGGIGALVGSQSNTLLSFAAAALLAIAFQPVRARARRFADRLVYGKRATPYEVLAEFSDRMSETYATEDVLPRMAEILRDGSGATAARVWLRVGAELRPVAASGEAGDASPRRIDGDALPEIPGEHTVEVRHQGELLGALSVEMPPSDPMNPAKDKLVRDLAAQAGLVLRNVRLISELRASRQRLVAAQDEERRKLERNLHDGAQQQLVALAVKLRLAEQLATRDAAKSQEMLSALQTDTQDALENLRDLARGIYPPLLADKGLGAALEGQARKASIPVEISTDGAGRYPQETEAAVYFCCLEALQNVQKYANASRAVVRLAHGDGHLIFEVADDGAGFDPGVTRYGTGLQGMADRLDAIGGTLEVRSRPGDGTTLTGTVPIAEPG